MVKEKIRHILLGFPDYNLNQIDLWSLGSQQFAFVGLFAAPVQNLYGIKASIGYR